MTSKWLETSPAQAGLVALSAVLFLVLIIVVVRVVGLRSFSKMSSFDFAVTVAIGSLLATVAVTDASLSAGAVALVLLLGTQWLIARLRQRTSFLAMLENEPLLLMEGSTFLEANMRKARVTRSDVLAKLREANVTNLDDVLAVVLETTGDVSVLQGDGPLDERLLNTVRRRAGKGPAAGESRFGEAAQG